MLIAPVLTGAIIGGPTWWHVLLLVTWLVAYCAFFAAGLWLRSRRRHRYVPPMLTYAGAATVLGLALVITHPALLRWAPVYALALAVSLTASARRADRSWLNDIVTVLAASLMTVVSAGLSAASSAAPPEALTTGPLASPDSPWPWPVPHGTALGPAWAAAGVLAAYFLGTVPYVKTLIRARGDRRVLAISVGHHTLLATIAATAVVVSLVRGTLPLAVLVLLAVSVGLLTRAVLVPRIRPWPSPRSIGLGEVLACVLVTAAALVVA